MGTISLDKHGQATELGRLAKAIVEGTNPAGALAVAEGRHAQWKSTPGVLELLKKAAVSPMSMDTGTLAVPVSVTLAEYLRSASLLGRLTGTVSTPFDCRLVEVASGGEAKWVGEGAPVPATLLDLDATASILPPTKLACLSVFTSELLRLSTPKADALLGADVRRDIGFALDVALLDPRNGGTAGVKPASITHGATQITSSGASVAQIDADLKAAVAVLNNASVDLTSAVWLMHPRTALFMGSLRGSGGGYSFPGLGAKGGQLLQLPVLTSAALLGVDSPSETSIVLLAQSELLVADDGEASLDYSTQADIQMTTTPAGGAATLVSMWQHNLVALKATRTVNWRLRHSGAVATITDCQY